MRYPIKITENFIIEPIMHTFGAKQESSYVELGDDALEVSMGMWFHETIPLSEIGRIAPSDWPWWGGLGVKLAHHGVGIVGSLDGVVNLQLKAPRGEAQGARTDTGRVLQSLGEMPGQTPYARPVPSSPSMLRPAHCNEPSTPSRHRFPPPSDASDDVIERIGGQR